MGRQLFRRQKTMNILLAVGCILWCLGILHFISSSFDFGADKASRSSFSEGEVGWTDRTSKNLMKAIGKFVDNLLRRLSRLEDKLETEEDSKIESELDSKLESKVNSKKDFKLAVDSGVTSGGNSKMESKMDSKNLSKMKSGVNPVVDSESESKAEHSEMEFESENTSVSKKGASNGSAAVTSVSPRDLPGEVRTADRKTVHPLPPPTRDYKQELQILQVRMEAETEKCYLMERTIEELHSDKRHLQQQVARLEELLMLLVNNQEKQREQPLTKPVDTILSQEEDKEDCPMPPLDGYPECQNKLKWMKGMWESDPCYRSYGVNGSLCSFLTYLSEVEIWCPVLPGRVVPPQAPDKPEDPPASGPAEVRDSLNGLTSALASRTEFQWIQRRVSSMEEVWVRAGSSLTAKYNLKDRKAKQILVHPGLVNKESGFRIAESAFTGGPLGELVQWADLLSTLHILGHHAHLSASLPDLREILQVKDGTCPTRNVSQTVDLIYTDIVGLQQIKTVLGQAWVKYKCRIRVLDSFGTEPDFNHEAWARRNNLLSVWGGLNLNPLQIYTMFPHTPDNTFLGFVVEHHLSSNETHHLQSTIRHNQALVYGKQNEFWKGKKDYLDLIHKHIDVHGTVAKSDSSSVPSYVINHGIVSGTEVQVLLRQSKVFVGLSFPYEGPAPLEAMANGCAFLNPRLRPPHSRLNTEFFKDKPNIREVTSQHPYAEAIGEPYVWTIDMDNATQVEKALTAILNQTIEPFLPYEFTCEGMLQRANAFIQNQDFCHSNLSWPPLSALQVVMAETGTSCKSACQKAGLICEPTFFPRLNTAHDLAKYSVDCVTSESSDSHLVLPAYNTGKKHCLFQSDPLLFSCVRSDKSLKRICPCRDYIKEQVALCKACV